MTTIAVMQPYFFPYGGYFRLFAGADVFVVLDCVQLPRPGWVHRNRFPRADGSLDWLTLPLAKASYTTSIKDLKFRTGARNILESSLRRFPLLEDAKRSKHWLIERMLDIAGDDLTAYLQSLLEAVTRTLGIAKPMVRSSTLGLDTGLHGQDRVLAIVEALGGTHYVNASGGRALYDTQAFARRGVRLQFLRAYGGGTDSILARLLTQPQNAIAQEIVRETVLED